MSLDWFNGCDFAWSSNDCKCLQFESHLGKRRKYVKNKLCCAQTLAIMRTELPFTATITKIQTITSLIKIHFLKNGADHGLVYVFCYFHSSVITWVFNYTKSRTKIKCCQVSNRWMRVYIQEHYLRVYDCIIALRWTVVWRRVAAPWKWVFIKRS